MIPNKMERIRLFSKRSAGVTTVDAASVEFWASSFSKIGCCIRDGSCDLNNIQLSSGNVSNKNTTIKMLTGLKIVSFTGIVPMTSSKTWSGVATNKGADADNPACQNKKPL